MSITDDLNIEFNDVTFRDSYWRIYGFNLTMKNTNFSKTNISMYRLAGKMVMNTITITMSTLGHIKIYPGFKIYISECNVDSTAMLDKVILDIAHCHLNIVNCTFHHLTKRNSGPAILSAVNSQVQIFEMECFNNSATNGLIQIQNNSQMMVKSSSFENNGHFILSSSIVSIQYNSMVLINDCTFQNNHGLFGSCLYSNYNTSVVIEDTSFTDNSALKGGAIYYYNTPSFMKEMYNELKNNDHPDRSVASKVIIKDSHFSLPETPLQYEGGALYIGGSSVDVNIKGCEFYSSAWRGGSLFIKGISSLSIHVSIDKCNFWGAAFLRGGSISVIQAVMIISDSKFTEGGAIFEGAYIQAAQHSIVNITNCTFPESFSLGGFISIEQAVMLNIAHSRFITDKFFGFSFINSIDNCSVTIYQCYFTNYFNFPTFTYVFSIHNYTSLTVTDSIFETSRGINLIVLLAMENIEVKFINCTFNKISGFRASHNTNVNIDNSRITNCINSILAAGFIEITDKSHLYISNSSFSNNKVVGSTSFINVQSNSSMTITNTSYEGNRMSSHLVASSNTTVIISNCIFTDNTVVDGPQIGLLVVDASFIHINGCLFTMNFADVHPGTLFSIQKSELSMDRTLFYNNAYTSLFPLETFFILVQSAKMLTVTNSIFNNNTNVNGIFNVSTSEEKPTKYFLIDNCSFEQNEDDSIHTDNVKDIIIHNSFFIYPDNSFLGPITGITIKNGKSIRMWNSTFQRYQGIEQFYLDSDLTFPDTLQLFTLNSLFSNVDSVLETNNTDFLSKAKILGFIKNRFLFKMKHKETGYASRKYYILR